MGHHRGDIIPTNGDIIPTNGEKVAVKSADDERRILSVAQDILFCTRLGHVKPLKHMTLPMAVYHLTRSY